MMKLNPAIPCGFALDLLLADPDWMPHPVVYMGRAISALEDFLRPRLPETPEGELLGGAVLAAALPAGTLAITSGVCALARNIHPAAGYAVETLWCWQGLALKGLAVESGRVRDELERGDLPAARKAVARIVGRDTQELTAGGVTKAAVETVAENTSDGVIAPLLFLALGGGVLGMAYKAVNTMDSMVGYKNERFRDYGTCAARLDDVLNFVPARLSGVLLCLAAALTGLDGPNAWKIFCRDRLNHKSPNSAHTEAAAAGALRIELAGSGYYFGKLVEKPVIGDPLRPVEPEDIVRVNRLMYAGAALALLLFCAVPLAALCIFA